MSCSPEIVPPLALGSTERRILDHIRSHPGHSRAELAHELGLSRAMLTKAVARFLALGLVSEVRETPAAGARGQPALRLTINGGALAAIGVNLTTRGLHVAAVDLACREIATLERPRPASFDAATVVPEVAAAVERLLATCQQAGARCLGIAIAVRGFVDRQERIEEVTPSQREIPYEALRTAMQARFRLPVFFESSAQAFFEASQPGNRHQTIFHVLIGYGIGGVLAEGTRIYRGGFNQAGNIGALVPEARPRPSLTDLAAFLDVPLEALSNAELEAMLASGDPRLDAWFETRAPALSMPLSAVVQLFNPEAIVVGGELPRAFYERLVADVDLAVFDAPGRMELTKPEVRVATLTGEGGRAHSAASVPIARLLG